MTSSVLDVLIKAAVASSCGMLLTLLLRKPLCRLFGPGFAYSLWLLVPTSLVALLLPVPRAGSKLALVLAAAPALHKSYGTPVAVSLGSDWGMWVLCAWVFGALLFCWMLVRQQRQFMSRLGPISAAAEGVFRAAHPSSGPVVVGIRRPTIVVPSDFDTRYTPREQALILAHERMHIQRGDLVINATCALARCVFWFNPLIHVAARLMRFDQELACDAAVMRSHPHSRKLYANAMLITQLADGALPLGCHWPATHPLKERIMLLQLAPAGGFRRALGRFLVGSFMFLVGYGTWAAQPDAPSRNGNRVSLTDSGIHISANYIDVSKHIFRYSGNVIIELPQDRGAIRVNAQESQADGSQMVLRGNVRIEVNGRVLTTQHAILSKNILQMDEVVISPLQDTP